MKFFVPDFASLAGEQKLRKYINSIINHKLHYPLNDTNAHNLNGINQPISFYIIIIISFAIYKTVWDRKHFHLKISHVPRDHMSDIQIVKDHS